MSDTSAIGGMWPTEVASLYGVTEHMDAKGQCVGILALAGGYLPSDLSAACAGMGRQLPLVVDYQVNGAANNFGGGDLADAELALDLQIIAALVPSARIVVYFGPNNIQQLAQVIHEAVNDNVNRPKVLSISWGSAEKFWSDSIRKDVNSALAGASDAKVTVVAAAGDQLATDGLLDGAAHVLFPASSPYVLACGGTQLELASDGSTLLDEKVWNDGFTGTGGGISDVFDVPPYQQNIVLPRSVNDGALRRGVPDVSAAAGQTPGYRIILNGKPIVKDGTSAATPLWASLIAMVNARRGQPIGLVQPILYRNPLLCRPILKGNNRIDGVGYEAGPGWNPCTGLGVPNGMDTVDALVAAV
jgi:kumamolisin